MVGYRRIGMIAVCCLGLVACAAYVCAQGFLSSPFTTTAGIDADVPEASGPLWVRIEVPDGHYVYAKDVAIDIEGAEATRVASPDPVDKYDEFLEETVRIYEYDAVFRYQVTSGMPVAVSVSLQGCSPDLCFMPETKRIVLTANGGDDESQLVPSGVEDALPDTMRGFVLTGREAGFRTPEQLIDFVDRTEAGGGLSGNWLVGFVARYGIVLGVLLILLGGIGLNFTPCVLPMIPVNLSIIGAGTQAASRSKGLWLGSCYGFGMAAAYGALGIVVAKTGQPFGQLNASPWFNAAVAVVFFVLALSMFGVFSIDLSRFQPQAKSNHGRGRAVTAFGFGVLAALLAGACVAPVVIGVILLATTTYSGTWLAWALPLLLGVGMALPWPFAGAGMSVLPKPGRWMERVKILFGIVIILAAAYYGFMSVRLFDARPSQQETVDDDGIPWVTSLDEGLAQARATGKPVFIDLWASWCKTCKKMSRTTFQSTAVRDRLEGYVAVKFQTEDLRAPEVAPLSDAWGIYGLPSYVILEPDTDEPSGGMPAETQAVGQEGDGG